MCGFSNVYEAVCMCGFCSAWECVCVGILICGCVCGFCKVLAL